MSQLASPSVKPSAMCCTTAMPTGKVGGSPRSSVASARGPPSEAPITTTSARRPLPGGSGSLRSRRPRRWRITLTPESSRSRERISAP